MLAPTHSVFGIFLTLILLAVFGVQWGLHWTIILVAVVGSIMPDIDYPRSLVGTIFRPISAFLENRYGHRTVTHSLLGWLIASLGFGLIIAVLMLVIHNEEFAILAPRWAAAFSLSYFSHLLLDMFNKRGSQMFWPDQGRDVIPKYYKLRTESGAPIEVAIFLALVVLMVLALPISTYGVGTSLRWLLATPEAAIDEFKELKTHCYVDLTGIMNETREHVAGRAEILGVDGRRLVVLYQGKVYTVSDRLGADILSSSVRVSKTDVPITMVRREFVGESRDKLLAEIPPGALVFGVVHLPEGMEIKFPVAPGDYKTMEQKGSDLKLSFASREEVERLALTESYDLQTRNDEAELAKLYADKERVAAQINEDDSGKGLTPLGQQLLANSENAQKHKVQLTELNSQLGEIGVKIEELRAKMRARRFVFAGEVYLRQ
jgi:membrane-bound metal-dependent hydrolase YbcI (DUF457 family)